MVYMFLLKKLNGRTDGTHFEEGISKLANQIEDNLKLRSLVNYVKDTDSTAN